MKMFFNLQTLNSFLLHEVCLSLARCSFPICCEAKHFLFSVLDIDYVFPSLKIDTSLSVQFLTALS